MAALCSVSRIQEVQGAGCRAEGLYQDRMWVLLFCFCLVLVFLLNLKKVISHCQGVMVLNPANEL